MKKVMLAGVAMLLIAGSVVFANGHKKDNSCCPIPGCKCMSSTQNLSAKPTAGNGETCPGHPGCICAK